MSFANCEYTRDEVLDKLIAAGLGDTDQHLITQDEYRRAMAGEVVIAPRIKAPSSGKGEMCPRCHEKKHNKAWSYCRGCTALIRMIKPSKWQKKKKKMAYIGAYHPDYYR